MTIETIAEKPAQRSPWYAPSYAMLLLSTLGLQVGLYLSQLFGGLSKGQAVLIAVAATAGIPLWVIACRVFRSKSQFGLRTLMLLHELACVFKSSRDAIEESYDDAVDRLMSNFVKQPLHRRSIQSL